MIRSLSLRRRCAAASKLASAAPPAVRVDRDLLVLVRVPAFDERARPLVLLERDRLALPEREDLVPEPEDLVDDARARREPVRDPELLDAPVLGCGRGPPWKCW